MGAGGLLRAPRGRGYPGACASFSSPTFTFRAGHRVSTSIRTFRNRSGRAGGRDAAGGAALRRRSAEAGKVRWWPPACRRIRRIGACAGALTRALDGAPAGRGLDLVHPHALRRALRGRALRAAQVPCIATYHTFFEEYLHHYVPVLPRALGRRRHGTSRAPRCGRAGAHRLFEPMRAVLSAYGCAPASTCCPRGWRRIASASATAALFAPRRALHLAGRSPTSAAWPTRRTSAFSCTCTRRQFAQVPEVAAGSWPAGEGLAREGLGAQVASSVFERAGAGLRRLSGARHRPVSTATRRGRVRVWFRAPRPRAWCCSKPWRSAGGLNGRARHALDPRAAKRCVGRQRRRPRSPPRWRAC